MITLVNPSSSDMIGLYPSIFSAFEISGALLIISLRLRDESSKEMNLILLFDLVNEIILFANSLIDMGSKLFPTLKASLSPFVNANENAFAISET